MALMRLHREGSLLEWQGDVVIDGRDVGAAARAAGHDGDGLAALTWDRRRRQWRVFAMLGRVDLDGVTLAFGVGGALALGMTLCVGGSTLEVLDLTPPAAIAREPRDGLVCIERDGALVLPDECAPEVMVTEAVDGWITCPLSPTSADARHTLITDHDHCIAGGRRWQVHLPPSIEASSRWLGRLAHCRLRLGDGDEVSTLDLRGHAIPLPRRDHHALLRTLAEARGADAARPDGWCTLEEFAARGITTRRLAVMMHRSRHQLAALGVVDSDALFQEKPGAVRLNPALTVELGDA